MHHQQQPSYGGGYPGQSYHQQGPPPSNPYGYSHSPQPPQQPYGSPAPQHGYNVSFFFNSNRQDSCKKMSILTRISHLARSPVRISTTTKWPTDVPTGSPSRFAYYTIPVRFCSIRLALTEIGLIANNYPPQGGGGRPSAPPTAPVAFGHGAPQGYNFQYSRCTGKRKALLIGINYFGQKGQLRGCINDVKNMSTYLNQNFGYAREDMVLLTDDQQNPMSQPTKANILRAMHWLVKDAQPNDSLFFHYSGEFLQYCKIKHECQT